MDLVDLLKVVLRHWPVAVGILLIAGAGAFALHHQTPREYEASGILQLVPPELESMRSPERLVDLPGRVAALREEYGNTGGNGPTVEIRLIDAITAQVAISERSREVESQARDIVQQLAGEIQEVQEQAAIPPEERLVARTGVLPPEETVDGDEPFEQRTLARLILDTPGLDQTNPYRPDDDTSRLLEIAVESDAGRELIEARTDSEGFAFDVSPGGAPGIIEVGTHAADPQGVFDGFEVVTDALREELEARQDRADVPTTRRLLLEVVAAPEVARDVTGPVSRAVAGVVALGLIGAAAGAVLMDRRRSGQHARRQDSELGPEHQPPIDMERYGTTGGEPDGVNRPVPQGGTPKASVPASPQTASQRDRP